MQRPTTVPAAATWDDNDQEWVLAERNADGELHGRVLYFRADGTKCCATDFVDGTPHGEFARFHENGEPSRTGTYVEGALHGTNVFVRSTAQTTENFPQGLGPQIWRCELDYVEGNVTEGRLFDRDGRRVMEDGEPFPDVRPAGVPAEAHFKKPEGHDDYRWVAGAVRDNDDGTIDRIGMWRYWTPDGELVLEEKYVDGQLVFDRPDAVPEAAELDSDDETWVLEAPHDAAGREHGERCVWSIDGVLRVRETYAHGAIERLREFLADGSLGQDTTLFDGGVQRRKLFRRTSEEELDSFPNVTLHHPTAMEVEYLFDEHGLMKSFAIRDGSGAELERQDLHRNAANTTEQARFASIDDASAAWTEAGDRFTTDLNAWLAVLHETGEPPEDEPTFEREDLERAVLDSVSALNARGAGREAHAKFPLYYDGIGKAFWGRYGLVVDRVLHTATAIYARVHHPVRPPEVVRIADGGITSMPEVVAFGASYDKKYLAFAFEDRIEILHGREAMTLAYPTRYQHAGADQLPTRSLGNGRAMGVRELRVCPNGSDVVLVSAEGIYLVNHASTQRLYPLDATLDEYVEAHAEREDEAPFELEVQFPNADVSPTGDRITCGGMFRRGIMAGLAIYRRDTEGVTLANTSQADAFFPIQAVFHRTRPHLAFAACLYASLHNNLTNTTFRIDLDGLAPGDIDEFGGGIAQEDGVVRTIASFGDGFLVGFDNGYIRWMGVDDNLQQLGYVFVGGAIHHIDVSADGRSFTVASDSGLVSQFTLADTPSKNLIATMPVQDRCRYGFFRTYPPLIW